MAYVGRVRFFWGGGGGLAGVELGVFSVVDSASSIDHCAMELADGGRAIVQIYIGVSSPWLQNMLRKHCTSKSKQFSLDHCYLLEAVLLSTSFNGVSALRPLDGSEDCGDVDPNVWWRDE